MRILFLVCLAVVISVSLARPPRHRGEPRGGGPPRHGGPPPHGGPPRMAQMKDFPPMGPPPLDQACRIDDRNGNTIENNTEMCQSCAECSVGPFPASQNDIEVQAYFCRYHSVFHDLEKKACLIENVTGDSVIRRHRCHDSDQCNVGPVTMTLRDGTGARLYFCEMSEQTETEDSDEETDTEEEDGSRSGGHSRGHRGGRHSREHRGPPRGEGNEKPRKPIIDQLREDACRTVNATDNSVISRKDCCENCTGGPVTITTDDGQLQLFYCQDRIEGGKFPPPPPARHGGPRPPPRHIPGGPPPPPGGSRMGSREGRPSRPAGENNDQSDRPRGPRQGGPEGRN